MEFSDYLLAIRLPNLKETLKQHRATVKIIFSCCLSQLFQVFWEILSDVSLTITAKEKMINYRSLVLLTGFIYWWLDYLFMKITLFILLHSFNCGTFKKALPSPSIPTTAIRNCRKDDFVLVNHRNFNKSCRTKLSKALKIVTVFVINWYIFKSIYFYMEFLILEAQNAQHTIDSLYLKPRDQEISWCRESLR